MDDLSQREEFERLKNRREEVERLKGRLDDLQEDLEFIHDRGEIFYAVDFGEIRAYLDFELTHAADILTGFGPLDPKMAAAHHSLILKHLFHHMAPTLYLLPSYQQELTSFARKRRIEGATNQQRQQALVQELYQRAVELLAGFSEDDHELLRKVSRGEALSPEEKERLVSFLGEDFLILSVSISDFLEQYKDARRLISLYDSGKLSYSLESLLGSDSLHSPSDEEEQVVFSAFPKKSLKRNPFAKLLDARSLITLRDINQLFDARKHRQKLLFVTRDQTVREAAERLGDKLPVRKFIRSMETVFFHSIVAVKPDYKAQAEWLQETAALLNDLLARLDHSLRQIRSASHDDKPYLIDLQEKVLTKTGELWNMYINIQANPLLEGGLPAPSPEDGGGGVVEDGAAESNGRHADGDIDLEKFRDFWEFVSIPEYRRMAETADSTIWDRIADQPYYLMFITHLGEFGTERVSKVLADVFPREGGEVKTVLWSMTAALMPSVQFSSKKFERLLKKLTIDDVAREGRVEVMRDPFFYVVGEITSGIREPENFLFLAYTLGMLGLWDDALKMAVRSDEMFGENVSHEVKFILAFLTRRLAENESDPGEKLRKFLRANELADEAIMLKSSKRSPSAMRDDPRYLKLKGTIILLYHDGKMSHAPEAFLDTEESDRPAIWEVERGKRLLLQARELIQNDDRLEMEILNNLAYMEVLSETMNARQADAYLAELKSKFKLVKQEYEVYCKTIAPFFMDTCVMVKARKAKDHHDEDGLRGCLHDLEQIINKKTVMDELRNATTSHIDLVRRWIKEAEANNTPGLPLS
jgi:hypothetical protein